MLSGKAAIVGIGATDFSKDSGRSELRLAAEAVLDALDDAGLSPADVDGLTTFTMDSNTEVAVARAAGIVEGVEHRLGRQTQLASTGVLRKVGGPNPDDRSLAGEHQASPIVSVAVAMT